MIRVARINLRVRIKSAFKAAGFAIKMKIVMMAVMKKIVHQQHVDQI